MYSTKTLEQITIEPTSYCNARCPQCDRFDEKNNLIVPLKHLDISILNKNLRPEFFPNLKQIDLEGNCGDVLSHKNPMGLVYLYRDVGKLRMVTNGSIRNKEFFKDLATFKNLELVFSIDGLLDTNHLYRQECDFEKILDNANTFNSAGGNSTWKFIVFKHNEHQIDEAENLSKKMGFKNFTIQHSDRSWHNGWKWPVYNKNQYQFDLEPSSKFDKDLSSDHRQLNEKLTHIVRQNKKINHCPMAQQKKIFVDHNGYVIPCCMLSNDLWNETYNTKFLKKYIKDLDSVSLYKNSVQDIFESDFYRKDLLQSFVSKPMPKCLLYCAV